MQAPHLCREAERQGYEPAERNAELRRCCALSGARAQDQGGKDAIAGQRTLMVGVSGAAQGYAAEGCVLREGYAQGILSGRGREAEVGYHVLTAPRKIPRDSPAALPRAQKELMRSAEGQRRMGAGGNMRNNITKYSGEMMNYEEFEAMCNKMDENSAREVARHTAFKSTMRDTLIEITLKEYPQAAAHKEEFIDELTRDAENIAIRMSELLDGYVYGIASDEITQGMDLTVPDQDVSEYEKQLLEDTLRVMPPEQHAYFIWLNEQRVKSEATMRAFAYMCHKKMNESVWNYFPELIDFTPRAMRYINFSTYIEMSEWVVGVNYVAGEYIPEWDIEYDETKAGTAGLPV